MAKNQFSSLKIDKWDSAFFKAKIVRMKISGAARSRNLSKELPGLIERAERAGVNFLVVKIEGKNASYEKALLGLDFKICGENVGLVFKYPGHLNAIVNTGYKIRFLKPADRRKACVIASDAFRLSYLYRCGFSKRAEVDRYHYVWAQNLSKDKHSQVFVAKRGGRVAGFIALTLNRRKEYARIVLVAVQKRFRGLGIGKGLVRESIRWYSGKVKTIYVKTQSNNHKALHLYSSMGFRPFEHEKIYCKKL